MEGDEEEGGEGADDEVCPPHPRHGAKFDFFDFELEQRISSPEELEAIRTARIAFHFVMHVGEYHGFEAYQETLQSFATRQDAEAWLENQSRGLRVLIRIPTQQELDAGAA
ncbi:hypothetical protein JQX13_00430 [Archangium violaceum]|uniref:hypothetical protein n=1 Tax=Archangium violaceum TaxID=83451 RepID=UPI00193BDF68|nr:hypothetical protein [Archangium violaceum]QRK08692.1 hypothetical protein JQX13_00430 [Archangium violaceum]